MLLAVAFVIAIAGRSRLTRDSAEVGDNSRSVVTSEGRTAAAPVRELHVGAQAWSADTRSKLQVLDQILASRNDNDPRMDTELRRLLPEARLALRERYYEMKRESFNERGTVVFLLGRNLEKKEDFAFLESVLNESPCLSLSDCSQSPKPSRDADSDNAVGVTLNYPQLMALVGAGNVLAEPKLYQGDPRRGMAIQVIRDGENSGIPAVSMKAQALAKQFKI